VNFGATAEDFRGTTFSKSRAAAIDSCCETSLACRLLFLFLTIFCAFFLLFGVCDSFLPLSKVILLSVSAREVFSLCDKRFKVSVCVSDVVPSVFSKRRKCWSGDRRQRRQLAFLPFSILTSPSQKILKLERLSTHLHLIKTHFAKECRQSLLTCLSVVRRSKNVPTRLDIKQ